jgi:hypothetical protein
VQGIKLHERTMKVQTAQNELEALISKFVKKNDLTMVETLQVLTSYIQTELKYALREERHPEDPSTPGDEA